MKSPSYLLCLVLVASPVAATSVNVEGTDAIYLAGRSDIVVPPASDPFAFLIRTAVPTPEELQETHPDAIPVIGGLHVRAATPATGGINYFFGFGPPFFGPEGFVATGSNIFALDGISGFIGPRGPLVGVFLDDAVPDTGPAPATLDFTPGGLGTDFSTLNPELGQVFFIGDGFDSAPAAQSFVAPPGATRLFLGIADAFGFIGAPGYYDDNDGAFSIELDLMQVDIDIKFCSDPNAFNCKKKGVLPVTVFGSDEVDVTEIDPETLQLCTSYPDSCTGAPRGVSVADRGDPSSDLGASMCAVDTETGLELDTLNPDGFDDMDVAFEAADVRALLGDFCAGERGALSQPLVLVGMTYGGTEVYSVPIGNGGIDQLVKKN